MLCSDCQALQGAHSSVLPHAALSLVGTNHPSYGIAGTDTSVALNVARMLSPSSVGNDQQRRLFGELERVADESMRELCSWIRWHLIDEANQASTHVSANFMLSQFASAKVESAGPGYGEASRVWTDASYVNRASRRLTIIWSSEPSLEGFWVPFVPDDPLPGAPVAMKHQAGAAVFVDDLYPWPKTGTMLEELKSFFLRQSFAMFLSLPIRLPDSPDANPVGILNLNFSRPDYAFYDTGRVQEFERTIQLLCATFGELAHLFHWAVEMDRRAGPVFAPADHVAGYFPIVNARLRLDDLSAHADEPSEDSKT